MKITTICHASVLVEVDGMRILTDPWIVGPTYANNHWIYPPSKILPEDIGKVDYIFMSHGHEDHLQKYTLDRLLPYNRDTKVIIPDYKIKWWEPAVRSFGLKNTILVEHDASLKLSDKTNISVFINDKGDMDASLLVSNNSDNVFIQTDNLMSYEEAERIGKKFDISLSYLIPTLTGPWPTFFDFDEITMKKLSIEKRDKAANYSFKIAKSLNTKNVIPFACDQFHYGEDYHINDLARGDKRNYIKLFDKEDQISAILMQTGDELELIDKKINVISQTKEIPSPMDQAAWAIGMRKEFRKFEALEKKYLTEDYAEDLEYFITSVQKAQDTWDHNYFHVRWIFFDEIRFKEIERNTIFGEKKQDDKSNNPNLIVEIPTYRIQNLVRGEYHMGFPTFNSGCMKVFRDNPYQVEEEKYFWDLIKNINYKNKKIDD